MKRFACFLAVLLVASFAVEAMASEPALCDDFAFEISQQDAMPADLLDGSGIVTFASGACEVTRYCDYPPPTMVTCTSQSGDCEIGPNYVACDGNFYVCSPPPCSPDCDDVNGGFCKSGSTTCEMAIGGQCESFTCNCWNNQWACP